MSNPHLSKSMCVQRSITNDLSHNDIRCKSHFLSARSIIFEETLLCAVRWAIWIFQLKPDFIAQNLLLVIAFSSADLCVLSLTIPNGALESYMHISEAQKLEVLHVGKGSWIICTVTSGA